MVTNKVLRCFLMLLSLFFCQCKKTIVMNGEHMYAYDTNSSRANLGSYHVKHAVSVVIKESGDALLITAEDEDMKAMKNGESKIHFTKNVAAKNDGTFSIPVEKANRIVPKFYYSTT